VSFAAQRSRFSASAIIAHADRFRWKSIAARLMKDLGKGLGSFISRDEDEQPLVGAAVWVSTLRRLLESQSANVSGRQTRQKRPRRGITQPEPEPEARLPCPSRGRFGRSGSELLSVGRIRRSSRRACRPRLVLERTEDLVDDGRIGKEGDDPHGLSASAQQRIRLIDPPDHPRPLAAQ
jgi:hypothetical protein